MICFQISIFEPLETTEPLTFIFSSTLWFAFKLVSLNHWKQHRNREEYREAVVICFQISIFEPLETTRQQPVQRRSALWFAFKLVSLNHWKQRLPVWLSRTGVVICFQISIFEPLETTVSVFLTLWVTLWFAFKLVSLNHWKQPTEDETAKVYVVICFQISIFEPLETTINFSRKKIT